MDEPAAPDQRQRRQQPSSQTPLDDYWVRKPSDRKWGTLTLAASRLAERRAREAANRSMRAEQEPEIDSLADEYYATAEAGRASRTLPRSFGASPAMLGRHRHHHLEATACHADNNNDLLLLAQQNQSRQQQFNSWLRHQIGQHVRPQQYQPPSGQPLDHTHSSQLLADPDRQQSESFNFQQQQQQQLPQWFPKYQLQPQFHQRSISQVEPPLASYHHHHHHWMLQQQQQNALSQLTSAQQAAMWTDMQPMLWPHYAPNLIQATDGSFYARQPGNHLHQQPPPPNWMMLDTNDAAAFSHHHQQQAIGKRNTLQRSTLPLAATTIHSAPMLPTAAQTGEPLAGRAPCAFLPVVVGGFEQDEPPPLPPLPPPDAAAAAATNTPAAAAADDDPVTANACLGSYKRKRRLPHIEAQFTITPPQLPPKEGGQAASSLDHRSAARREREAVQNGHLFVRAIHQPQPIESPQPRGMPQAGQRSEQRRLKSQSPLRGQVKTIGAREKIETYLRHYDQVKREQGLGGCEAAAAADAQDEAQLTPPASQTPLQVGQVEELTFQPYHNLPSLKYTINLPLQRAQDGTLMLNETSHLRRSRRSARNNHQQPAKETSTTMDRVREPRPKRKPLGSSSSCPAPPAEFCAGMVFHEPSIVGSTNRKSLAQSLESAMDHPSLAHHSFMMSASGEEPVDSLEHLLSSSSGCADHSSSSPISQPRPFYLRSPTISPADYSSIRETLLVKVASPPPPPVPPHRSGTIQHHEEAPSTTASDEPERPPKPEPRSPSSQSPLDRGTPPVVGAAGPQALADHSSNSSSSSQSPNSTSGSTSEQTLSSSSSSSSGTATENGGDMSEIPTNDHSVDENYEFDQVSSCSSSTRRQTKGQETPVRAGGHRFYSGSSGSESKVQVNGAIYSQVNKRPKAKKPTASRALVAKPPVAVVMRSQLYDASQCKEQPLRRPEVQDTTTDYYDTVHDDDDPDATIANDNQPAQNKHEMEAKQE